jgi:hypothetical protein
LVGGSDDHGIDVGTLELVHTQAVLIDFDRHELEAGAGGDLPLLWVAGVFDRDPPCAGRGERAADEALALRVAAGDDDVGGVGDDAPHPPEVVGERGAERLDPGRVAVAEFGVRDPAKDLPQRAKPGRTREEGEVGHAGPKVEARTSRRRARRRLGAVERRRLGHVRVRPLAEEQVALGTELGIGVHDHAA